jgi:hypothetical protein
MPNWVITRIYITGPEDKIKEFEDEVLDLSEEAEEVFSFSRLCPMPEELANTTSPDPRPTKEKIKNPDGTESEIEVYQSVINSWEISRAISAGQTPPEPIICNNATPEQQKELMEKYGVSNWYDWNNHNWGTKWNASESTYNQEDKILEFQTAWSTPEPIHREMARRFPDLTFAGTYADEDFGCNTGSIENGEIYPLENLTEEACETAATLWGMEGYWDDEKEEWIFDGDDD